MNGSCYGSLNLSNKSLPYLHQQFWETKSLCGAESKDQRERTARVLQLWRNEGSAFLDRILTVDESWIHSFEP